MILSKMTPSLHICYEKTLTSIKHDRFLFGPNREAAASSPLGSALDPEAFEAQASGFWGHRGFRSLGLGFKVYGLGFRV